MAKYISIPKIIQAEQFFPEKKIENVIITDCGDGTLIYTVKIENGTPDGFVKLLELGDYLVYNDEGTRIIDVRRANSFEKLYQEQK